MPLPNSVVIASAGSGKTTWVVRDALGCQGRTAVVSYTHNNTRKVREKFAELAHAVPDRVTVDTWFAFLLRDLVRPYQTFYLSRTERIAKMCEVSGRSAQYTKKFSPLYFFSSRGEIYSDKVSEFALRCNELSRGLVFDRLKALYQRIYIDEVQDLAGYDLELIEAAMRAGVRLRMVGDNRQATYSTNNSPKNSAYRSTKIIDKFRAWAKAGLCEVTQHAWSYRCKQEICDLSDTLFPDFEATTSRASAACDHNGVFLIQGGLVDRYVAAYRPQVLVWNKNVTTGGHDALNFGESKGLEFPHVLIFPTAPIRKWLKSGNPASIDSEISRAKLYVAITRAQHSVAFVFDENSALPGVQQLRDDELP
jgi:DNA helicase II / ATP-dependent DNA helicase PcrA